MPDKPGDPAAQDRLEDPAVRDRILARVWLRLRFREWLRSLSDNQLTALDKNWENVMNDAVLDRVDSWVIAARTSAELREGRREEL